MKKRILKYLVLISFMVSGCSVDLKTKALIKDHLKYESVSVIENFFNLTYVENHAIAFGMFSNLKRSTRMPIVFVLPVLITVLSFWLIWKIRSNKFRLLLPLFIMLGGAYGNILDRILHGYVTDFLHFHYYYHYSFYVFNVADVLVNIGMVLILLQYKEFNRLINEVFAIKPKTETLK